MASRPLITEALVREAARGGSSSLAIPENAIITPLARDAAKDLGVGLVAEQAAQRGHGGCGHGDQRNPPPRTLAVAADHAGFEIKAALIEQAQKLGWSTRDLGTESTASVDYPDFAYAVARLVASGGVALGVMIDGVGVGSAMVANKLPGIRAACCSVEFAAFNARAHNDANVLTLGSRTVGLEANKRILEVFLTTDFEGGRHATRVAKICDVEKKFAVG